MNRLLTFPIICVVSLGLVAVAADADESVPAEANQNQAPAQPATEESRLLQSRLNLARQIHLAADFESQVGLRHANGLGVDVSLPDAALKAQLKLAEREGVTVTQVPEESAGAKAGLKVHDVIIQVGNHGVGDIGDLDQALEAATGQTVKLKLWRAGKQIELEAAPQKLEYVRLKLTDLLFDNATQEAQATAERFRIGVTLSEADETLRQHLRLAAGEGLVVTEVLDDGAAAAVGIQSHDVLTMLDGKRLTTVEAVNEQIQELKDKKVELRLLRGGEELTLHIAARKTQEAAFVDRPILFWNTKACQNCHVTDAAHFGAAHHGAAAHHGMAQRLDANRSAWTDGKQGWLYQYNRASQAQVESSGQHSAAAPPQQQIETLRAQLAEMQQTLAALEAALAAPKSNETEDKKQ